MNLLKVPPALRDRLGDAGSDGLLMMFAEAHRMGNEILDRRIAEVEERFRRHLHEELSKFRLEMVERMGELRFDLLKWSFLFWVGQVAVIIAVLSWMLRGLQ
jgi:hypothetical protein